ncbi:MULTISPECIES: phytanoyl-CoA dioxygenase family protein [Mycolicibacterium]|uniref:Phytanoyl-CoA dioxygenase (PhyH) family protein n=1 Tax=Mycolicibacterium senegalense TaxID=1796 RepID=A0A378SXA0_9MYCO|nr:MULTISPECIES: phytanoyl-CoA dioxygenase family protein [Mycolicibacterium]MDR7291979.1 ectoine hydroxylase-related dioxygenase (phytanoyl-CoA dioxygenase family) [Mycolicibacterium senegalense]QZA23402.1 phytanoyl-CoA dioxygenase family protein [Mycolicibacterium senegalense]CDP89629.1 phytanoyl-CoA dioxygenase (PhyH) family protein [Mycolicibacterium farcinogenes]STZ53020.1 phytanoyl-CoA dioxygenase (PhyH) family protein [Mycolicibacterium senegalense]
MSEMYHLPNTATMEEITAALRKDGFVIVDNLVPPELMDQIAGELTDYIDDTPNGRDNFVGRRTRRTGALIARSPASRKLVMHPLARAVAAEMLKKATAYQLHLTQVISVYPGETAQPLHRDELAWDFFPFPEDYDVQCNTIWAMTDFTVENGATRVVPGSHKVFDKQGSDYTEADEARAVMSKGSVFFYTGKVYHSAAANVSEMVRQGINITYAVGWVRQEENQYLSTPLEIAKTLDDDMLKLMGYQMGGVAMGYLSDFLDPLAAVRPELGKQQYDFAALTQTTGHVDKDGQDEFHNAMLNADTPSPVTESV